ncbi:MAG TPA: hypothetical protein VF142_11775 [Longimicrobium sp.]
MAIHTRDPPLLVRLLRALGRALGIIKHSSGGEMKRPDAPPGLERPRQYLTELRAQVNSYCEAVPAGLRTARDADVRLLDAQLATLNAPVASVEADILALEARADALRAA